MLETGGAVYTVRGIDSGRWNVRLTAERTT